MKPSGQDLDGVSQHIKTGAIQVIINTEAGSLGTSMSLRKTLVRTIKG